MNRQTAHPAVLIVDDDPDILTALDDLIEHDGFRVTDVSICRDALAQVKAVEFAAVLLDIGLPDGDGLAVLQTIQAITLSLPVIVLTAFTSQDVRAKSLSGGAFSCLTNRTIAMKCVQYFAGPLGWAGHPRLPITDVVGMMGSPSPPPPIRTCGTLASGSHRDPSPRVCSTSCVQPRLRKVSGCHSPRRLLHPPTLSLPRQPLCPGTRLFPCGVLQLL
jgi:CheY-like chemotaxis protein